MHRLSPEHLQIDKPLPWDVYDAQGQLLLRKGYLVEKDRQIEMLLERGMFVDAEQFKASRDDDKPAAPVFNPFWLWDDIFKKLTRILKNIEQVDDFADSIEAMASLLQFLSDKDADAGISVLLLLDTGKYPVAQSLHTAVVCELVAKRMGWSQADRLSLVSAAMTMNVGMMELQGWLVNQNTPLTDEQRQQINHHPQVSHDMLKAAGVTDSKWLTAVLQHHERRGGKGYPHKVMQPDPMAELIHLADVFCAKVSPRAYRKALAPNQAAKELFLDDGGEGNPLPAMIIKEVGIFPPGSFVKLQNGETAVVVRRGQTANTPIVFSLVSGQGVPFVEPMRRDSSRKDYTIVSIVPKDKIMIRLNPAKLWGY
ncbi:HD-GYP domain-containing protein [Parvibium lacunae]|nr:HD domain-containing phosphohydrolase [Parvibium lacunae]